jgi:hypothetical protein
VLAESHTPAYLHLDSRRDCGKNPIRSVLTLLNQFYGKLLAIMSTAKQEVESLLSKLPDDCSLEDIQYHLYIIEKVRNGLEAADSQSTVSQEEVERRFGKWLTE